MTKPLEIAGQTEHEDILYRFPHSHAALELLPDHRDVFRVRLCWLKGKGGRSLFESTAFRPLAEVTLRGQTFPVYLNQHSRKTRDRIQLAGRRKTATAARAALRFLVSVEGRENTLLWSWRVGATAPALAAPATRDLPDSVRLRLPFPPGVPCVVKLATGEQGWALAVWTKEIAVTLVSTTPGSFPEVHENAVELFLSNANLEGSGATLNWETRATPARSAVEVHQALRRHLADVTAAQQQSHPLHQPFLGELSRKATSSLMRDEVVKKRGVDRLAYKLERNRSQAGEGADTALAACALLARYYLTGDDALRRRARLLGHGVCDFQATQVESPHWGALWDVQRDDLGYEDIHGGSTISLTATARASVGLHLLHAHFQTEILSRTAIGAAQWLLLRMDKDGLLQGERFHESNSEAPIAAPWAVGEALIPLVETFRRTGNETFQRAALRSVNAIEEALEQASLSPDLATTEQLASLIEGILRVSREYESERMIALAKEVAVLLRTRLLPDGSLGDPLHAHPEGLLRATLAGARGALALSRVDKDHRWLLMALRALGAAQELAGPELEGISIANLTGLTQLPLALLLAVGALGTHCTADRERVAVVRQWQTFAPEPAAWEYVQVTTAEGAPVDYLPLVCPTTLQVLIPVIAPPGTTHLKIVKNNREPMLRNLLTGDLDTRAALVPLGDGKEAMIGVFLADT